MLQQMTRQPRQREWASVCREIPKSNSPDVNYVATSALEFNFQHYALYKSTFYLLIYLLVALYDSILQADGRKLLVWK